VLRCASCWNKPIICIFSCLLTCDLW